MRSEGDTGLVDADPWLDKKCVSGGALLIASTYNRIRFDALALALVLTFEEAILTAWISCLIWLVS